MGEALLLFQIVFLTCCSLSPEVGEEVYNSISRMRTCGFSSALLVKGSIKHAKHNTSAWLKSAEGRQLNLEHVHRHLKCRQQDVFRDWRRSISGWCGYSFPYITANLLPWKHVFESLFQVSVLSSPLCCAVAVLL